MKDDKLRKECPVILIAFKEGGENGGPFTSHKRIVENINTKQYILKPFFFPRSRVLFSPKGLYKLIKRIKEENAVAMHIGGLQLEGFVAMIVCKLAGIKILLAIHGSEKEASGRNKIRLFFMSIIEYLTIKNSDIVYGVSDYVCSWPVCRHSKKMIGTIYNLPSTEQNVNKMRKNIRTDLGIEKSDIVVVSTGRIVKDKGFDILFEVIKNFKNTDNISFVIAGEGDYREEMTKALEKTEMKDKVFLLGYRTDIDDILDSSDIFIMCSKHETLCISLQEAGMHGLPLIATDVGGIPEIVDESCGFLVENYNVQGFVSAINKLKDNTELRVMMGENAKKKMLSKFNSRDILSKLDMAYMELIKK